MVVMPHLAVASTICRATVSDASDMQFPTGSNSPALEPLATSATSPEDSPVLFWLRSSRRSRRADLMSGDVVDANGIPQQRLIEWTQSFVRHASPQTELFE